MAHKIIQWNCRGLRSNYNDLAILLQEHSPSTVCLQETDLKPNTNISFKNYSIINCFGPANNERVCWRISILVKDGTPHQQITLKTNLQAVAVNINCHRPMTICSVYFPPNRSVDVVELRQLVKQLPKPFMLLGDFNGHHTMWGCRDINPRGRIIEDFLSTMDSDNSLPTTSNTKKRRKNTEESDIDNESRARYNQIRQEIQKGHVLFPRFLMMMPDDEEKSLHKLSHLLPYKRSSKVWLESLSPSSG